MQYGSTDDAGEWTTTALPEGRYRLKISVLNERPFVTEVESDGHARSIPILLPERSTVRFRVVGHTPLGANPVLVLSLDELVPKPYGWGVTREVIAFLDQGNKREVQSSVLSPGTHEIRVAVYRVNDSRDFFQFRRDYVPVVVRNIGVDVPDEGEVLVEIVLEE